MCLRVMITFLLSILAFLTFLSAMFSVVTFESVILTVVIALLAKSPATIVPSAILAEVI